MDNIVNIGLWLRISELSINLAQGSTPGPPLLRFRDTKGRYNWTRSMGLLCAVFMGFIGSVPSGNIYLGEDRSNVVGVGGIERCERTTLTRIERESV